LRWSSGSGRTRVLSSAEPINLDAIPATGRSDATAPARVNTNAFAGAGRTDTLTDTLGV